MASGSADNIIRIQATILRRLISDDLFFQAFRDNPQDTLAEYGLNHAVVRALHSRIKTVADAEKQLATLESLMSSRGISGEMAAPDENEAAGDLNAADVRPRRIVNTGFVSAETPANDWLPSQTLPTSQLTYFWLDIGEKASPTSIEATPTALPPDLPTDARLDIVLFGFPDEPQVLVGATKGQLQLAGNSARVTRPADTPQNLQSDVQLRGKRLFFAVQTPDTPGAYQLRCHIYYQQNLLQSRLVTFHVTPTPQTQEKALLSELDYTLSQTFDKNQLENMGETLLSVFVNSNGNETHGFRFFGQKNLEGNAQLSENQLIRHINESRRVLRYAAWNKTDPYQNGDEKNYRYDPEKVSKSEIIENLKRDLRLLAQRGYQFYNDIIDAVSGSVDASEDWQNKMLSPGQIQFATKQAIQMVVPVAMIYDYGIDDGIAVTDLSICHEFEKHLFGDTPLEQTDCFQGKCPTKDDWTVVCPSGFWGYRHFVGLPVSVDNAPDAPTSINASGKLSFAMNVSTDTAFIKRAAHEQALQGWGFQWGYADERNEALDLMGQDAHQFVYFYCHGGLANDMPYISVGPKDGPRLTPTNLRGKVRFKKIRPLIFINGCHTTALTPENGINFVKNFIQVAEAAGVVGTEITIFESIAVMFGEECIRRFLVERQSIGEAIRGARLHMLRQSNPLGLVYVPYVMPSLKIVG